MTDEGRPTVPDVPSVDVPDDEIGTHSRRLVFVATLAQRISYVVAIVGLIGLSYVALYLGDGAGVISRENLSDLRDVLGIPSAVLFVSPLLVLAPWATGLGTRTLLSRTVETTLPVSQHALNVTECGELAREARSTTSNVSVTLARAIEIRDETLAALAEWDSDLEAVLFDRRLLAVASEPLTAAFNEAFERMLDEVPDTPDLIVSIDRAQEILDHARAAWEAWELASKHAEAVGLGTMTGQERIAIDRARKHLAVAANPGATAEERRASIGRVIDALAGVTHRARAFVEAEVLETVDARCLELGAAPLRLAINPPRSVQ